MVHVDAASLDGHTDAGDGSPAEICRRLLCDAGVVPSLQDDTGRIIDVGKKQRTIPAALRRALWARDGGCRFPGCTHTICDAHHALAAARHVPLTCPLPGRGPGLAGSRGVLRLGTIVVVASALAAPAAAGRLNKVVHGLKYRSGQTGNDNTSSSDKDDSSDSSSSSSSDNSSDDGDNSDAGWGYSSNRAYTPTPLLLGSQPYPTSTMGSDVHLYLGMMSVYESDGAMRGTIRASSGNFGVALDGTRFYEEQRTPMAVTSVHLDVWSIRGTYRAVRTGNNHRTAVWLHAGLAGQSSDGLHLLGVAVGADVAHNINHALGVEAGARVFAMQDDIRAVEVRAGVAASILRVSYRVLKFNVGPALRGPEVGVALQF